jgi:hypothetical protein
MSRHQQRLLALLHEHGPIAVKPIDTSWAMYDDAHGAYPALTKDLFDVWITAYSGTTKALAMRGLIKQLPYPDPRWYVLVQ